MKPLAIVGIGAATGGLSALEQMLDNLPDGSGLAVVVLLFLPHESDVPVETLLSHHTGMTVKAVQDGVRLFADTVYVLSSKAHVTVKDGRFSVSEVSPGEGADHLIDSLFASLALEEEPRAVGVILSGEGDDGARGVRAIHEAGGMVIAQNPLSAHVDEMPWRAIHTGVCNDILYPHQIPEFLLKLDSCR